MTFSIPGRALIAAMLMASAVPAGATLLVGAQHGPQFDPYSSHALLAPIGHRPFMFTLVSPRSTHGAGGLELSAGRIRGAGVASFAGPMLPDGLDRSAIRFTRWPVTNGVRSGASFVSHCVILPSGCRAGPRPTDPGQPTGAVPVPSTLALLGIGMLAGGLLGRRRQR